MGRVSKYKKPKTVTAYDPGQLGKKAVGGSTTARAEGALSKSFVRWLRMKEAATGESSGLLNSEEANYVCDQKKKRMKKKRRAKTRARLDALQKDIDKRTEQSVQSRRRALSAHRHRRQDDVGHGDRGPAARQGARGARGRRSALPSAPPSPLAACVAHSASARRHAHNALVLRATSSPVSEPNPNPNPTLPLTLTLTLTLALVLTLTLIVYNCRSVRADGSCAHTP